MTTGNIFIPNDTGITPLLDRAVVAFEERGHTVRRGEINKVGERKIYTADEVKSLFHDIDVAFFTLRHGCTRELMGGAPKLKGVCSPVIGVESIDRDAAADLGIIVGNGAVRANNVGMAESTVMLMLMLMYDVQTNIARMKDKLWRRPGHHSNIMEGRTIGLIGFGNISREIALRMMPFNVKILTYSPSAPDDEILAGVQKVDTLETLMSESDIVCVMTTLTPKKHHMVNAKMLSLMKPAAYLVNTGRGALVEEAALIDVLKDKRIAGAALDAFEIEPLPHDSPLRDLDNVILTPHCVGHVKEVMDQFVTAMVENAERIIRGELPLHCKNPHIEPQWRARLDKISGE